MRCARRITVECPTPERCELEGCPAAAFAAVPGRAVIPERRPIDLPALEELEEIGVAGRAAVRIHHAFDRLRRARPITEPELEPVSVAPSLTPSPPVLSPPALLPPAPKPKAEELRVVAIDGGWIVYAGAVPAAVATDPAAVGAQVAALLRR